jgi:hypothetical protein
VPLLPGETYVFKIPESRAVSFEHMKRRGRIPPGTDNRLEFKINTVSFGNGNGFIVGRRRGIAITSEGERTTKIKSRRSRVLKRRVGRKYPLRPP